MHFYVHFRTLLSTFSTLSCTLRTLLCTLRTLLCTLRTLLYTHSKNNKKTKKQKQKQKKTHTSQTVKTKALNSIFKSSYICTIVSTFWSGIIRPHKSANKRVWYKGKPFGSHLGDSGSIPRPETLSRLLWFPWPKAKAGMVPVKFGP